MSQGYRSPVGSWLGGLNKPQPTRGYRGFVGFWLGGLCSPAFTPEPEPEPEPQPPRNGFVGPRQDPRRIRVDLRRYSLMQLLLEEEDVLLATIAQMLAAGALDPNPSKDDS